MFPRVARPGLRQLARGGTRRFRVAAHSAPRQTFVSAVTSFAHPSSRFHTSSFYNAEDKGVNEASQDAEVAGKTTGEGEEVVSELEELRAKIAELEARDKESKENYVRSLAEVENVRRIAKRDVENASTYAASKFAKTMLEVADNLERALENVSAEELQANEQLRLFHEGVEMTNNGLLKVFGNQGVVGFGKVGEEYDPNLHTVLFEYEDEKMEPGSIGQVMSVGYMFKDRVLRPASVGTIKKT
jgi:molecular chaperone GrpE